MRVVPIDGVEDVIASWLSEKDNHQWLDFGHSSGPPTALSIRLMRQRETHYLRCFTADDSGKPIGLVAFSEIHPAFRTARLWYVLGDKRYSGTGQTSRAVGGLLKWGFREMQLKSVNAWAVEANKASISVLRKNGFRQIGTQRKCHYIDDRAHDRLLFDLLAEEFGG